MLSDLFFERMSIVFVVAAHETVAVQDQLLSAAQPPVTASLSVAVPSVAELVAGAWWNLSLWEGRSDWHC